MDSYITNEDARDYADLMGIELPEDEDELTKILRRASIYLDRIYANRYLGTKVSDQVLAWPRQVLNYYDAYGNYRSDFDIDSIPHELEEATVELAGLMNEGYSPNTQPLPVLKKVVKKLDGLESTIEYGDGSAYVENPLYRLETILGPLMWVEPVNTKRTITMTRGG